MYSRWRRSCSSYLAIKLAPTHPRFSVARFFQSSSDIALSRLIFPSELCICRIGRTINFPRAIFPSARSARSSNGKRVQVPSHLEETTCPESNPAPSPELRRLAERKTRGRKSRRLFNYTNLHGAIPERSNERGTVTIPRTRRTGCEEQWHANLWPFPASPTSSSPSRRAPRNLPVFLAPLQPLALRNATPAR